DFLDGPLHQHGFVVSLDTIPFGAAFTPSAAATTTYGGSLCASPYHDASYFLRLVDFATSGHYSLVWKLLTIFLYRTTGHFILFKMIRYVLL
ncbi:unnamed protein product, partial [Citrullus colocynthis]